MIKALIKFMGRKEPQRSNDFSDFFTKKSSGERTKVLRQAIREANIAQKEMVTVYRKTNRSLSEPASAR